MASKVLKLTDLTCVGGYGNTWIYPERANDGNFSTYATGQKSSSSNVGLNVHCDMTTIPAGASIKGIELYWRRGLYWPEPQRFTNGVARINVLYEKSFSFTNGSYIYETLGGPTDLWGAPAGTFDDLETLDIDLAATYGYSAANSHGFRIYEVEVTIHYEESFNPIVIGANF